MSIQNKFISIGDICWLYYNTTPGQSQCGDYAYLNAYAKNRSEKIEDGKIYVKVKIREIAWKYTKFVIFFSVVNKGGSQGYQSEVADIERLTLIKE